MQGTGGQVTKIWSGDANRIVPQIFKQSCSSEFAKTCHFKRKFQFLLLSDSYPVGPQSSPSTKPSRCASASPKSQPHLCLWLFACPLNFLYRSDVARIVGWEGLKVPQSVLFVGFSPHVHAYSPNYVTVQICSVRIKVH